MRRGRRWLAVAASAIAFAGSGAAAEEHDTRKVLAVFAHPDDELIVAPALARAAREGDRVTLVFATSGDQGPGVSDMAPGDALARHREGEARCSTGALGTAAPIFLRHGDGTLGFPARHPRNSFEALEDDLDTLVREGQFDIVVTWGPDGGYGHSDHRMVSAITTQVVQAMDRDRPVLLYPAIGKGSLPPMPEWQAWHQTDPALLDIAYEYGEQDLEAATRATQCHKSQFDEATREGLMTLFDRYSWKGANYFRIGVPGSGDRPETAAD